MTKTTEKNGAVSDLQAATTAARTRNGFLRSEASLLLSAVSVSAFGGAMAATLGEADAAVVLSPLFTSVGNPTVTIPATLDGLYINVETGVTSTVVANAPGWDINPYSSSTGSRLNFFNPTGGGQLRYPGVQDGPAGSLDSGTEVGPSGSYNTGTAGVAFGSEAGKWKLAADNLFGFKFVAADGGTKFGWGTMRVGAAATTRSVTELYYENTGASILVGQRPSAPSAVPEPSAPLALLALGATGMLHRRVRRRG